MRKSLKIGVLLVFIMLLLVQTITVEASSDYSKLPTPGNLLKDGLLDNNPYFTTYRDNYHMDVLEYNLFTKPDGWLDNINNNMANIQFKMLKGWAEFEIFLFCLAMNFDPVLLFGDFLKEFTSQMRTEVFEPMSTFGIIIIGLYFIVNIAQSRRSQIWGAIITTICMLILGYAYFKYPIKMINGVSTFSNELSKQVLTGTFKAASGENTPKSATSAAVVAIWKWQVHDIWEMLEFGDYEMAKQYSSQVLSLNPNSNERKELIKRLRDNEHFNIGCGADRFLYLFINIIPVIINTAIIVILSIVLIVYKFLLILYFMLFVFILMIAIIPFFGTRVVRFGVGKVLGAAYTSVIVCFSLAVICIFNGVLYKMANTLSWPGVMLLQCLIGGAIYWKRNEIFDAFATMRMAAQDPNYVYRRMRRDMTRQMRQGNSLEYKLVNRGIGAIKWGAGALNNIGSNKSKSHFTTNKHSRFGVSKNNNSNAKKHTHPHKTNNVAKDMDAEEHNTVSLKSRAEAAEYLDNKYRTSKGAAEAKAKIMGGEPKYSPFVKRVMARESFGASMFEPGEIMYAAKQLENIKAKGGNVEDLYIDESTLNNPEVERPSSVIDVAVNTKNENDAKEQKVETAKADSKQLAKDFNKKYNTKYDKAFFENLIKRYGEQNVKAILEKMETLKGVKNPAGYLTQSLKNNQRDQVSYTKHADSNLKDNPLDKVEDMMEHKLTDLETHLLDENKKPDNTGEIKEGFEKIKNKLGNK